MKSKQTMVDTIVRLAQYFAGRLPSRWKNAIRSTAVRLLGPVEETLQGASATMSDVLFNHREEQAYHDSLERQGLSNEISYLNDVTLMLSQLEGVGELVAIEDLMVAAGDRHRIGIRIDCCGTLSAALCTASLLSRRGIPATFFLHHNSRYWGPSVADSGDTRLLTAVEALVVMGMGIGLHNDSWGLMENGIEPVQRLNADLALLRSVGCPVTSVVSHNSAWSYGLENSRIFTDFGEATGTPTSYKPSVALADLGLVSDSGFPNAMQSGKFLSETARKQVHSEIRSREYLKGYFLQHPNYIRSYDFEIWLVAIDTWVIADYRTSALHFPMTLADLRTWLTANLIDPAPDTCAVRRGALVLHPEYVSRGLRSSPYSAAVWARLT